jgi:hypothetical protein
MGTCHSISSGAVPQPSPESPGAYCIRKHGRAFAVYDPSGALVCITVYLTGAFEVIRRLGGVAVYAKPAPDRRR